MDIRRLAQIKKGDESIGNRVRVKIVKNKVASPFRTAEFDILFNQGISAESDIINTGVKYGVVAKSGSWFTFGGEKLGQGMDASRKHLKDHPEVRDTIVEEIKKKIAADAESKEETS